MTFSNKLYGNVVLPFYISVMEEKVTCEQRIAWNIEQFYSLSLSSLPSLSSMLTSQACCCVLIFFWIAFFSCSSKVMKKIFFFCSVLLRAYRFFSSCIHRCCCVGFFSLVFFYVYTHIHTHTHLIRFRMKEKKAQSFMRKIPQGKKSMKFHATYVLLSWQLRHEVKYKKKVFNFLQKHKSILDSKIDWLGFLFTYNLKLSCYWFTSSSTTT